MKRISVWTCGVAMALSAAIFAINGASADDAVTTERTVRKVPATSSAAGQLDDKTMGANIRASKLIGMNLQNAQGKSVGEINDIVIDAYSGQVRYAAVTYGGFLGVGNKMFAVPFAAIECQREAGSSADHVLVLNVTQGQLDGATGFDEDHWPNFADRNFTSEIDKRYGVLRDRRVLDGNRAGKRGVDIDVNRGRIDIEVDGKRD